MCCFGLCNVFVTVGLPRLSQMGEKEMTISTTLSIYLVLDKENNYRASGCI